MFLYSRWKWKPEVKGIIFVNGGIVEICCKNRSISNVKHGFLDMIQVARDSRILLSFLCRNSQTVFKSNRPVLNLKVVLFYFLLVSWLEPWMLVKWSWALFSYFVSVHSRLEGLEHSFTWKEIIRWLTWKFSKWIV